MITRTARIVAAVVAGVILFGTWIFPVIWTAVTSLKLPKDIFTYPPRIFFVPSGLNYEQVLGGEMSLVQNLATSAVVAVGATVISLGVGIPMAYVFARSKFRGRSVLALYTLFTYLIPRMGIVVPLFVIFRQLDLFGSFLGLIAVYVSFSLPFAVWLLVPYFEDIPKEMEDAALVDRAGRMRALWYVILPQVRGGVSVTAIFVFINAWNEFVFGLILGSNEVRPVTVAMYNFIGFEQTLWGPLTAGAIVAIIPVVVLGLGAQRGIIRGLTAGSVKGGARQ